jgi:hypothetical protein
MDITKLLGVEFKGYYGQDAVYKLLREKRGHIKAAFHRDDIGGINLVWGDESAGLAHIIKRRTEQGINAADFLSNLAEVVEKGEISKNVRGNFELHLDKKIAVISPELWGNKLTFVLTAYKTRKKA